MKTVNIVAAKMMKRCRGPNLATKKGWAILLYKILLEQVRSTK